MKYGLIFDCDGTLVDSEQGHYLSWQEALKSRGRSFTQEEYYPFIGQSGLAIAKQLAQRYQFDSAHSLYEDKNSCFYRMLRQQGPPAIQRTVDLLHKLYKEREKLQIRFAVASAAPKEEIMKNLSNLGLSRLFELVVSGKDDLSDYHDPEGVNKPKPYIYLHTVKLLGLKSSDCIAFEDSTTGVLAATRAGVKTIAVPNRFTLSHDFSAAHEIILPDVPIEIQKIGEVLSS